MKHLLTTSQFLRSNRWNKNLKISPVAKSGWFWQKWDQLYFSNLPHLAGCPSRKDSKSRKQALEVIKQVLIPSDNNLKSDAFQKLTRRLTSENRIINHCAFIMILLIRLKGLFEFCLRIVVNWKNFNVYHFISLNGDPISEWISWKTAKCHFISNGTLQNFKIPSVTNFRIIIR